MKQQLLNRFATLSLLAFVALFASCGGKDDEDPKTITDYLSTSKWTMEEMTSDDLDDLSLALYEAFFEGYEITYKADGTYTLNLPLLGEFGSSEGVWELSSDQNVIFHEKGTEDEESYTIKKINGGELHLEFTIEDDESKDSYTVLMKLRH